MKTAFASGVLLLAFIPALAHVEPAARPAAVLACDNVIVHEPLLVFEVKGSTLAAQVDRTLIVFADGSLKLAEAEFAGQGRCARAQTTPESVLALKQALTQAGAAILCDDPQQVTDVPLRTLTFLRGAQDARAHTFSYWLGAGDYAVVDALLEQFIAEQFPQ